VDEKPWHAIAREYLGWLHFVTWPYRAYQWLRYFQDKRRDPDPAMPRRSWFSFRAPPRDAVGKRTVASYDFVMIGKSPWILFGIGALFIIPAFGEYSERGPAGAFGPLSITVFFTLVALITLVVQIRYTTTVPVPPLPR
jgi:hypothetical protein